MDIIPYRSQYTYQELQDIFYPRLFEILFNRAPTPRESYSNDNYLSLINALLGNPFAGARFLHLIFGDPKNIFGNGRRDKDAEARLDLFAQANRIEPKVFKRWYQQGTHDVDIFLALKRFLIDGSLGVFIPFGTLNEQSDEILQTYSGKSHVLLVDADNLYYYIGPLFKLTDPDTYSVGFFRKNNISPIYAGYHALYYRLNTGNQISTTTVEAYGARKDAADVELTTAMAYMKIYQATAGAQVGKYYIVTGDEYAYELAASTNDFFGRSDYAVRLNSQPTNFTDRRFVRSKWTINPADFPMRLYGKLNLREIEVDPRPVSGPFDGQANSLNNLLTSNQPSTSDPTNSMWMIEFIKVNPELYIPVLIDYEEIFSILTRIDISSYQEFMSYINNNYVGERNIELKEQYLVLIAAKYFTRNELITYFLLNQYNYIESLRQGVLNGTLERYKYRREGNDVIITDNATIIQFISLSISNRDIFNIFFKISHPFEAYIYHIDVLLALSINNVTTGVIDPLHPENINILSFRFTL